MVDVEGKVSSLQSQLLQRDKELKSCKSKIGEYMQQIKQWETEHGNCEQEKAATKNELAALKDLCDKLDVEKEKLNAEVAEYSGVRREVYNCTHNIIEHLDVLYPDSHSFLA